MCRGGSRIHGRASWTWQQHPCNSALHRRHHQLDLRPRLPGYRLTNLDEITASNSSIATATVQTAGSLPPLFTLITHPGQNIAKSVLAWNHRVHRASRRLGVPSGGGDEHHRDQNRRQRGGKHHRSARASCADWLAAAAGGIARPQLGSCTHYLRRQSRVEL